MQMVKGSFFWGGEGCERTRLEKRTGPSGDHPQDQESNTTTTVVSLTRNDFARQVFVFSLVVCLCCLDHTRLFRREM
jgi:hypothetical protein